MLDVGKLEVGKLEVGKLEVGELEVGESRVSALTKVITFSFYGNQDLLML